MQVRFRQRYPWALLPYRQRVDLKTREADAMMYAANFRFLRRYQVPEMCYPWRMGNESGWLIPSPIDMRVDPVDTHEVEVAPRDRSFFAQSTGLTDVYPGPTGETMFASERHTWLRISDVKFDNGFAPMFAADRDGFVNWRLGWQVTPPPGYHVLVLPIPELEGIEVGQALHDLSAAQPDYANYGFTIAIRPQRTQLITRRQPLARLLVIHSSVLTLEEEYEYLPDETGAAGNE